MQNFSALRAVAAGVICLGGFVVSATQSYAQAAMTWGTPTFITGDSDVSLAGSLVWAYNFGNASLSPTVNGVTFTGTTNGNPNITLFTSGSSFFTNSTAFGSTSGFYTALSSGYQDLLRSASYWSGSVSNVQTMTFNNLTAGATYQFQVWVNDSRNGFHGGLTVTFSDGLGDTAAVKYNNSGASLGQYVIGSFTATGTTELLNLGPYSPQMNAASLRMTAIPEPSTYAALVGIVGLGVGVWGRRRKRAKG